VTLRDVNDDTPLARMPIFARTRYTYDSYSDFWRLVELSGFPTCFVDEIDLQSENTYIVCPVNGELRPHVTHRRTLGPQKAKIIWWNLERPDCTPPVNWEPYGGVAYYGVISEILNYVDEVWVSDRHYASLDKRMKFVPLGSHPGLGGEPSDPLTMRTAQWDVALMAAPVPRRDGVIYELKKAGLSVAPNAWGTERERILRSTKIMLNVHQHENPLPIGEPLRFALAAAYKMALVSEYVKDPSPLTPFEILSTRNLLGACQDVLRYEGVHEHMGENLHRALCVEHNFRRCVEEALQ